MNRRVYIFVNGILTNPLDTQGWTDRACRWIDRYTEHKADRFEYLSGAITRRLFQNARVEKFTEIVSEYVDLDLVLVAHSNGCDIISRFLLKTRLRIKEIHLIAAACERDFSQNGINAAMEAGRLDDCFLYGSKNDKALQLAFNTGKFLRFFGLGYGTLGLKGPKKVACPLRVHRLSMDEYDHSTWFDPNHFENTMRLITRGVPK